MKTNTLHVVPAKRKKDTRIGLLNPSFKYVKEEHTDIRLTFARIRAEMAQRKAK